MIFFKKNIRIIFPIGIAIGLALIIFWKTLIGFIPFPGNYLLAWYEPWKTETMQANVLGIPHKPVLDDVFRQLYPYKILFSDVLKQWKLPLWNPYNGNGMPFLATMHAGFLTPMNLLFLFFQGPLAWTLYICLQPFLLSLGFYGYFRTIGLSKLASVFGIVIFVISGFSVARYEFGEYMYVAACLPIFLVIFERYKSNVKTKTLFLLPFLVCFMLVSGQPQMVLYVLLFAGAYGSLLCFFHHRSFLPIMGLLVLGLGFSGIQLIPTIELYLHANMSQTASAFIFERFLLPLKQYITIFVPNYYGNQATYNYWGAGDYVESIMSVGTIPMVFVCSFFFLRMQKRLDFIRIFCLSIIGITVLVTVDWPLTRMLYSIPLPIIGTGVPSRIFFLFTFSVAILGAIGLDEYLKGTIQLKKAIIFVGGVLGGSLWYVWIAEKFAFSCHNATIFNCWTIAFRNTLFESFAFCFFVCILFFGRNKRFITGCGIIFIVLLLGWYNANKFLPFSPVTYIFPNSSVIESIKHYAGNGRVFGMEHASLTSDIATQFRFFDAQYYEPLYIKRYGELISYAKTLDQNRGLSRSDVTIGDWITKDYCLQFRMERLMQLLSINQILYKKNFVDRSCISKESVAWENETWMLVSRSQALPHVFVVPTYEVIQDGEKILRRLFDESFDPFHSVIVEKQIPNIPEQTASDQPFSFDATIDLYKENSVSIRTHTSSSGVLMLTDNYYPGWMAYIDSVKTPLYRANYSFRAIALPSGDHTVVFRYQPYSVTIGSVVSLVSGVILLLWILLWRKKNGK